MMVRRRRKWNAVCWIGQWPMPEFRDEIESGRMTLRLSGFDNPTRTLILDDDNIVRSGDWLFVDTSSAGTRSITIVSPEDFRNNYEQADE